MTNNKQQTAVQWYAEKLYDLEMAYNQGVIKTNTYIKGKREAVEQAKEMEKDQMIQAWKKGDGQFDKVSDKMSLEYYKKEYEGKK